MAFEAKRLKPPSPEQFAKELLSSSPSLKEPKARLSVLLAEYVEQHSVLQAEWKASQRKPDLEDLIVTPPDLNKMEETLREWHGRVLEDMLRLDAGDPKVNLHWDDLYQEVIASAHPFGGLAHSAPEFALHRLLRRQGQMRAQRLALHAIHQEGVSKDRNPQKRRNSGLTTSPAQRALHAIDSELELGTQRLRRIRDFLCGNQDCLNSITSPKDAPSFMSSSAWRGAATVLVRQMLLEDVATKDLRQFLLQLQYLGFASRSKIWRKSLEHRAVMEIACDGSSGGRHRVIQSNLAPLLSVPLGATNRKRLESTLQELAQGFSMGHTSMQPDRGKTFAHQAALAFTDIFEKQQQKWQFRAYPIQSCVAVHEIRSIVEDGCFLRPSPWAAHLPKPNLDEEFEEQRMLLDASYARRGTPLRVAALNHSLSTAHRSKPTYARQLLDQSARRDTRTGALLGSDPILKGIVEVPGGGSAPVDSLLGYELKTLQLADSSFAARRCNEKAEEPVGGPGAGEFAANNQVSEKMPQHLLRAYYLLRFLQSRSCRWRLLAVLNFFRFVQRRLLVALGANLTTELDEGKGSSFIGRESDPSHRVEEKAQDKYWDISSRGLSRILRHCTLPFTDDAPNPPGFDFDPLKLDRETHSNHESDTFIIKDSSGRQVLHEAALDDLDSLELEMLKIGSYFIHKYEAKRSDEREIAAVDRCAVLYDLLASEVWFNTEKQTLVDVYLNIFEDTTDLLERRILAQRIIDVIALRPRLDLQEPYFVEAYSASILLLRTRSALLKELQQHQVSSEVSASKRATSKVGDPRSLGKSAGSSGGFNSAATTGSSVRSGRSALLASLDSGLAHPQEGTTLSGGVATSRREGEIMCVDGDRILRHNTCCLVWKAELILESVHKDLARHFQTPPVASTQLERACYVVALEKWSQQQEPYFQSDLPPQEDPELHLTLLQELAKRLLGIEQQERQRWRQGGPQFVGEESGKANHANPSKYHSWVESISMNDMMTHAFEEISSAASDPSLSLQASYQHALGCLLSQFLEFLELRGRLLDTSEEVQHLQKILKEQAIDFGSSLRTLPNISGEDANALRGNQLTAALVTKSMGTLQASTSDALLMQCSRQKLQELRLILQHELAFRGLALACVQQNALLLDPQTRSKELSDISTIGLSRDAVASDGGLGVIRRLRDSLEISGHDKNHPHAAAPPPDQDFLTSTSHHSASEVSKASGVEDKGAAIMDMSRYAQYLQQPARYLEPVIAALGRIWTEVDSMREHRLLRFKLLRCSSLMALRASCDLVLGLQVAHTSNELARMAMLLPKSLTPFTYGDRVKPLVERDGQVTNIFSLPSTFDSLQLRSLPPREMGPLAETLAERAIEATEELDFEEQLKDLDFTLSGPAVVALEVLNAVAHLFALRYAICMLDADPVCLLEAQRQTRSPTINLEQLFGAHARSVQERSELPEPSTSKALVNSGEEEIDTGNLSRAGPAYEAMEDLCADIARLVSRLHALGAENCRKPAKVLDVLQTEIRSAQRCLAAILRRSTRSLQERGEANQACALRNWSSLVEEADLFPGDPPRPWFLALTPAIEMSLPQIEPCAQELKKQYENTQEPCWNELIDLHQAPFPLIARFHEDAFSYISYLHPSILDWQQELPDLVAAMQSRFIGAAFPKKQRIAARIRRLPWQMSALPSTHLLRLPLSLNSARRYQLSRARSDLMERCQALHWIYGVAQDSNAAVYAESEMFGLILLHDRLQEVLAAGHLGWSQLPSDAEGLALLHAELAGIIPPEEPAKAVEISGALELEPKAVRIEVAALRKQLAALVPALAHFILSTATECLSEEFSALVALQFRLQSVSSSNVHKTTAPEMSWSRKNEDVGLLTGGPFAEKLDGLQPVAELLTKSTYVRMDNNPDGEAAHVLKELQINACLEDLVFGLWSWGRLMSKSRERRTQEILGFLDHVQKVLKFRRAQLEVQTIEEGHVLATAPELDLLEARKESMKEKRESMEAQFRADVAARAVKMVFEVDRVHRCQRNLKAAAAEIQSRLQGEVMDQVRSTISNFTGALSAEDGRFRESHGISGEVLRHQVRDLREHVTSELSALAAKNQAVQIKAIQPRQVYGLETLLPEKDTGGIDFQTLVGGHTEVATPESQKEDDGHRTPMKRRLSQSNVFRRNSEVNVRPSVLTVSDGMYGKLADVASRREVFDLQMELKKLRDRQLLERSFHKFKCEAMRQHFKRKVQEQEATLESNSSLLGQLAEILRTEDAAASDFIRGAQEVSDAEKRTEELGPLTHSNAEQKRRLVKWKKNKSKQLYHMKKGVRDHEMAGTMDVASLLQDIQSKQDLVKMLQQSQREFDEEVVRASEESAAETAQVRYAMIKQREVKDDTFKELQRLRAEMQRPDGAKNVEYWRSKVMEIRQEMKSLEEENAKLRVLLSMREHPREDASPTGPS